MFQNLFGFTITVVVGAVVFGVVVPICCTLPIATGLDSLTKLGFKRIFLVLHFVVYGGIIFYAIFNGYLIPQYSLNWPGLSNPNIRMFANLLFMSSSLLTLPLWWALAAEPK